MMKQRKRVVVVIVVLLLCLMVTGCEEIDDKNEVMDSESSKKLDESDEETDEQGYSYVEELNKIGEQIINRDNESVQSILNQAYAAHGDSIENIYFANDEGKLNLSPALRLPDDYDARQRPWYKNALDKELYKPATYHDQTIEKNIQSIAKPLYKEGKLLGVLGMDYEVEDSQVIDNSKQINEPVNSREKKLLLSTEEKEQLKKYAEKLSNVVETEDDLTAIKKHFDEQIEKGINGVETIYLANEDEIFLITPYVELPENYNPSLRPWYEYAINDNVYISEVFLDVESNHQMIMISTKVELEKDIIGVLGIDFVIDL